MRGAETAGKTKATQWSLGVGVAWDGEKLVEATSPTYKAR